MRAALVSLLALSGCYGVSGLGDFSVDEGAGGASAETDGATASASTGTGTGTASAGGAGGATTAGTGGRMNPGCPLVEVSDDFSGPLANVWNASGATTAGEQLQLELPAGSSSQYRGVSTSVGHDLINHCASVQIVMDPGESNAQTFFYAGPADNRVGFQLQGGRLRFVRRVNGTQTAPVVDFEPQTHRYWRMWERDGQIVWFTSADGKTWDEQRRASTPDIGLDDVVFQLGIYTNGGPAKTLVIYDDFNRF